MIGAAILGAEVSFWLVLLAALACRYLWRRRQVSTVLLVCLPVIDLCLLALVAVDLYRGTAARQTHALAASYIGFTVAFAHPMTRWADQRFAHRFAGGPPPTRPRKGTPDYVRHLWAEWFRVLLAVAISEVMLLGLAILVLRQPVPSDLDVAANSPLWAQMILLVMVAVVWFLAGPAFTRSAKTKLPGTGTSHKPPYSRRGDPT